MGDPCDRAAGPLPDLPTVTGLQTDPRDPNRCIVSASDGRAFRVDAGRCANLGLAAGVLLDETLEGRLLREEDGTRARARALRFLETRERSQAEVQQRLRRYGYDEILVAEVMEWLLGLGYVDDRRFAEWFVRARSRAAWGPRRLRDELHRKGVPKPITDEVVASLSPDAEEGVVDTLVASVLPRFARDLAGDTERAERRISGYLARRGHDWETIRAVLRRLGGGESPHDGDV